MKRRSLFALPLLAFPARLFGQDPAAPPRRASTKTAKARKTSGDDDPTRKVANAKDDDAPDGGPDATASDATPANFPNEAGFRWDKYPIGDYTGLDPNGASPQTAIIEWILRRTGTAPWHGDKIAVLCASRTQLRAYNTPKLLKSVKSTVERFTSSSVGDVLSVRVRFIAAADPRWRYTANRLLTPALSGAQGQQCWFSSVSDTEMVITQMQVWQGFELLGNRNATMLNGQTMQFSQVEDRPFTAGLQRESAVGLGFQPKAEKLKEGVVLKFSPLLNYEGDMLDAAVELSTNLVRKLHPVKVLAPREVGPGEVTLDVPEASETRLNQTIVDWPLGQALIISAGIQPGILMNNKGGFLNMKIPGTMPTTTELLVVINVEIAKDKEKARPRDRDQ